MSKTTALTSESLVIGALLNQGDLLLEMSDLRLEYLSSEINRVLLTCIKRIYRQGSRNIDIADVYAMLETNESDKKLIDRNGGVEYLEQLQVIGSGKTSEDVRVHVKNIIDTAYRNEVVAVLEGVKLEISAHKDMTLERINDLLDKELLGIRAKYAARHKVELLKDQTDKIMETLDIESQQDYIGFPTALPLLNKFITYRKGELVVYSAKAKVGKSQTVVNEVYNLAIKNKIPTMVLDTELQTKTFFVRLMARITGYSFKFVETGKWKQYPKCREKVMAAKTLIDDSPIAHTYIVGWTQDEIFNEVKRMQIQSNVQIVFYDYIKVEEVSEGLAEHQQLGNITNWLKNGLAGELNIAVVALAQLSDYVTQERGFKIANSEKIKNYCSSTVFLVEKTSQQYADDNCELGGNAYLYIQYNRNGPQMPSDQQNKGINIVFEKNKALITEAPWQHPSIKSLAEQDEEEYIVDEDGDVAC